MLEKLDGGLGRQNLKGEARQHHRALERLGLDDHQDCVALPKAMWGSTLILHQRGRGLLTKFGQQVATAC